jgi:hypothetical protein
MTDPTKVETTDAREASMSRVQTQETILASLVSPASVESPAKVKDKPEEEEQKHGKKNAQERIQELVKSRQDAEANAESEKTRANLLEMKLNALEAQATPMEATNRPQRASYANDDDFVDALTDWKADAAIAKRESQHAEARLKAEQAEVAQQWDSRQQKAITAIPDYAEVIGKSEVIVPPYVHQALLESEQGPEIAYYLALHPEEAKRIASMKPLAAIKRIAALERDLEDLGDGEPVKPKAPELPKKSRAPEPINPVKGVGASNPGQASTFEEYRRRRLGK